MQSSASVQNCLQFSERGADIHLVGTSGNFCTMQEVHNDLFNITSIISSVSTFDFASVFGEKLEPHYNFPLRFSEALMGLSGGSGPPVPSCVLHFAVRSLRITGRRSRQPLPRLCYRTGNHVIKVGERSAPCNPNTITATFHSQTPQVRWPRVT